MLVIFVRQCSHAHVSKDWSNGVTQSDFDYNGVVNLPDFNLLAARFGAALPPALVDISLGDSDDASREELTDLTG